MWARALLASRRLQSWQCAQHGFRARQPEVPGMTPSSGSIGS